MNGWRKACRVLVVLVAVGLAVLVVIRKKGKQPDETGESSVLAEGPAVWQRIEGFVSETGRTANTEQSEGVISGETPQPEPQNQAVYAGIVRYTRYVWKEAYTKLLRYPETRKSVSKGEDSVSISNEKGENLYLSSGRILYKLNDSANQLFELTSYPARATERDGQIRQESEAAYNVELDDLSRDEAERAALRLMESLIQSEICRAEVVGLYGYTGKQLKRIHQTLYRERNVWRYFYRELPSEVENGLYYVEMRLNIGGVPVCTEGDARGIHGSVDSSDSIIPVKACLVLSKEGLIFLDFAYAFDLSDIRKADALPESAVQAIVREDLKNNPYAIDSKEFDMSLMNLFIRHGTGTKASYELCPVWRVQTAGKGDIDFCLAVYDAVSGKRLFEGLL